MTKRRHLGPHGDVSSTWSGRAAHPTRHERTLCRRLTQRGMCLRLARCRTGNNWTVAVLKPTRLTVRVAAGPRVKFLGGAS